MTRLWQMLGMSLCVCLYTTQAWAYEDQLTVGVGGGYAQGGNLLGHGGQLDLALGIGLDDIWTLRLRGTELLYPEDGSRPTVHVGLLGAELLYLVDVLEWVPFGGLGADALLLGSAGKLAIGGGGHFVVGLDYLPNREWIFGFDFRTAYAWGADGEIGPLLIANLSLQRVFEL